MRGACRRFVCAAVAGLVVFAAASSDAQPAVSPVRHVLVLQSSDRGNLTMDHVTANLRADLEQRAGHPVNIVQIVVNRTGLVGAPPEQAAVDFIRAIFTDRPKPDLIVTLAGPAAAFARKYRQQLFPEVPLLFSSVDQRYLSNAPLAENEAAVAVANDPVGVVDLMLRLLPETKQVFVVLGGGQASTFWSRELQAQFTPFQDRLTFIWSNELSFTEILHRCETLPDHSAILYLNFGSDAKGGTYGDERVLTALHEVTKAPIFGVQSVMLGAGIVGGRLMDIDALGRSTADAAIRILDGAPPRSVIVPPQPPGQAVFDWRELDRWGIAESRLPPGSVVHYRKLSLLSEHKFTVLGATGALLVQSLLIVGLLYHRRARQRAELDSRKNLALAVDASRRETMAALTSSITHQIGQPLSAMIANAHALRRLIAANRATPDTIEEIVSEIQAEGVCARQIIERHRAMLRSREMEKVPIDLHDVINQSLALIAHEMTARQIKAAVHLSSTPCMIDGDPVLLQQALVNLVTNAMDAMAETPPGRRHVTIRIEVRAADVEVSVRDNGTGLPADGTLFTPFVTTKSDGLGIGLTIARTIVDAHGGTLDACNNPEGGATFTFTLRRSEPPEVLSAPVSAVRHPA